MKIFRFFKILAVYLGAVACLIACTNATPSIEGTLDQGTVSNNTAPVISSNCSNSNVQDSAYGCTPTATDAENDAVLWLLDATLNNCAWATIDPVLGTIGGTPNDDQVGSCNLAFYASDSRSFSALSSYSITISNLAPTLSIASGSAILEDAAATVIQIDPAVQANEEGFGSYSFDHAGTTGTRCFDQATSLIIDSSNGTVQFQPALNWNGSCNIKILFDDGNGGTVTSEFSETVTAVNDAPVISASCSGLAVAGTSYSCSPSLIDVDGATPSWSTTASHTCSWASIDASTGTISGTPPGTGTCNLSISADDSLAISNVLTFAVSISAMPIGLLAVSDTPAYDFGSILIGNNLSRTFTISNIGSGPVSSLALSGFTSPFGYLAGSYPGTGGNCGTSINAGQACTFVLQYTPAASGIQSDTVVIDYNDGSSAQSISLGVQGTGVSPALLTVSNSPTFNFGSTSAGLSLTGALTVSNSGGVSAISIVGGSFTLPFNYVGNSYPGTGGTCGTTLSAGSTCTLQIIFSPTSAASYSHSFILNYFDGVSAQSINRSLTGTAVAPASLSISDGPTYAFATAPQNSTAVSKIFTVTNSGVATATSVAPNSFSVPFSFLGGGFPGTGGTCSASLAGGSTCTFVVANDYTILGLSQATISIGYNDSVQAQTVTRPITATSLTAATLAFSSSPNFNFGNVIVGSSANGVLTLTNGGAVAALTISPGSLSSEFSYVGGSYPGTSGNCSATLAAGSQCTVQISLTPSTAGAVSVAMNANYFDGVATQNVTREIIGIGQNPGIVSISGGPTYDYGSLIAGGSNNQIFTLTNIGDVPVTSLAGGSMTGAFNFVGGSYPGSGTCGTTLSAGASCTIIVGFYPTVAGAVSSQINVNYNDGLNSGVVATRAIQGTGLAPANLTLSDGPSYSYGTLIQGSSSLSKTFTITNAGEVVAVSIAPVALTAPFSFNGGTCSTSLNAGSSCTLIVEYASTQVGTSNQSLVINYSDLIQAQSVSLPISGVTATPASLAISNAVTFDFGSRYIGTTTSHTFTITNDGQSSAQSVSMGALTLPYTLASTGCGVSIAGGASCTMTVDFSPTASNSYLDSLSLNYNDGVAAQSATRGVQGIGQAPAHLTISHSPLFNFDATIVGATSSGILTIANSGDVSALTISSATMSAPFSYVGGTYPGTSGTCGTNLAASATCLLHILYSPTATGTNTETLTINYFNGQSADSAIRNLSGSASSAALLTLSDGPSFDFGTLIEGSAATFKTFTLTNSGSVAAVSLSGGALSSAIDYVNYTYPGVGGTCGLTLASGDSCTIVTAVDSLFGVGFYSESLTISYFDTVQTQAVSRSVTAQIVEPARLTISDGVVYDFANVVIGNSNSKTLTVTNSGGFSASAIVVNNLTSPFHLVSTDCSSALGVGSTCQVIVEFAPTTQGASADTLTIDYNDGLSAAASYRFFSGTGFSPANLTFSPTPQVDFGDVLIGDTVSATLTLSNGGDVAALTIGANGISGQFGFVGGSYPGTSGTCGASLPSNSSCLVNVNFTAATTGAITQTLNQSYFNQVATTAATEKLIAYARSRGSISISDGPTYDFGPLTIGNSLSKTMTLTNPGFGSVNISTAWLLYGDIQYLGGGYPGTGGTCTYYLPGGGSCTVVIRYASTSSGLFTDQLLFDYSDGLNSLSVSRNVQGTGRTTAALTLSHSPSYDFGTVLTGASNLTGTITLTNSGETTATSLAFAGLPIPFSFTGGTYPGTSGSCGISIVAGSSCTLKVDFASTYYGADVATLSAGYFDGAITQAVERLLVGNTIDPANVVISDTPTYNFGNQFVSTTVSHSFTVQNLGDVSATSISVGTLSAPFSVVSSNCGSSLLSFGICNIQVDFNPTVGGSFSDSFNFVYTSGLGTITESIGVQGTGTSLAVLSISDGATYNYGSIMTGLTSVKTFTITNSGGTSASSVGVGGLTAPFSVVAGGSCTATISANSACTVNIQFAPLSASVPSGIINVTYFDGAGSQSATRNVTGTGVLPVVAAVYPTNGAKWNDYVKNNNGGTNFNNQPDTACVGDEAGTYFSCIHGGERRKVEVLGASTCTNFTIVETLGVFDWECVVTNGVATFYTIGLKEDKGLKDLINFATPGWLPNSVAVKLSGTTLATSTPAAWWANPVVALPNNASAGTVLNLDSVDDDSAGPDIALASNTILVLATSRDSQGYNLNMDKLAIVTAPTARLQAAASNTPVTNCNYSTGEISAANGDCLLSVGAQKFLWIEGNYAGNATPTFETGGVLILLSGLQNSRIHLIKEYYSLITGISLMNSTKVLMDGVKMAYNLGYTVYLYSSTYNILTDLNLSNNGYTSPIAAIYMDYYSDSNIVLRALVTSNEGGAVYSSLSSQNTFSHIVSANSSALSAIIEVEFSSVLNSFSQVIVTGNNGRGLRIDSNIGGTFANIFARQNSLIPGISDTEPSSSPSSVYKGKLFTENCSLISGPGSGLSTACANLGGSSATVNTVTSVANASFVGYVSALDGSITAAGGTNPMPNANLDTIFEYLNFSNNYRSWAENFTGFPNASLYGLCQGVNCRIWDYSLQAGDTIFRNQNGPFTGGAACPASVNGNQTLTDGQSNTFLYAASEIISDGVGDNDGLCESSETCVYSPHLGVYQGSGDPYTTNQCTFLNGTVTNVKMLARPTP